MPYNEDVRSSHTGYQIQKVWGNAHGLIRRQSVNGVLPCKAFGGNPDSSPGHFGSLPRCPICSPMLEWEMVEHTSLFRTAWSDQLVWVSEPNRVVQQQLKFLQAQFKALGVELATSRRVWNDKTDPMLVLTTPDQWKTIQHNAKVRCFGTKSWSVLDELWGNAPQTVEA
jgi:hypothetical protein